MAGLVVSSTGRRRPSRPQIHLAGVAFHYPARRDPCSTTWTSDPAGMSTAIVGVNGAGKTTLVEWSPVSTIRPRDITVDGVSLADLRAAKWQRRVAVLFQDFVRYPLSARAISVRRRGNMSDAEGIVVRRAARVPSSSSSRSRAERTPSSPAATRTSRSLRGEWQRVALARALFAVAHGARLLVLDEPTAWLDVRGEADFFDRVLDIARGLTTIVISHRFSTSGVPIGSACRRRPARRGGRPRGACSPTSSRYAGGCRVQASRFTEAVRRLPRAAE